MTGILLLWIGAKKIMRPQNILPNSGTRYGTLLVKDSPEIFMRGYRIETNIYFVKPWTHRAAGAALKFRRLGMEALLAITDKQV